ncbi:hypothetical protein SLE2022_209830 [Rubroshorea leprosula]
MKGREDVVKENGRIKQEPTTVISSMEPSHPLPPFFAFNPPPPTSLALINLSPPFPSVSHPKASYKEKLVGVSSILVAQSFCPPICSQFLSSSPTSPHDTQPNPLPKPLYPLQSLSYYPFPRGKGTVLSSMET